MASGDLSGAVLDGRYKVMEPIAQGAMGVVYRAERLKLGKIVAIKVLHDELPNELSSRRRFELEAMAMAKLEHPHCAAVLDVGTHDGKPYVVMDFISGLDLKTLLEQGPVPIPRAVELVRQTLSGVAHAHELGIIHRDIKPANIILGQKAGLGDHVKILDFGLARLTQEQQVSKLTSGIVVGTPAYMAPEQIRGVNIDFRCDLYACGVLLFELLTGHKPFHSERDDPMEVVSMHLKQPPPRLADKLPGTEFGELEAVVAKALQKAAADRFQSASEFVAALDAAERAAPQQVSASMMLPQGGTSLGLPVAAPSLSIPQAEPSLSIPQAVPSSVGSAPVSAPIPQAVPSSVASAPVSAPIPQPYGVEMPTQPSVPFPVLSETDGSQPAAMQPVRRANPDGLPFSRKQLAIGAGGLLVVVILIAAIASGGGSSSKETASDAAISSQGSGEIEMEPTSREGADKLLARAADLVANGDREAAIDLLGKSRALYVDNAEIPYMAGKLYFAKLWWTDGLKNFRDAVRLEPRYKTDPELIKTILKGFITTPSYNDELAAFLRNEIGAPAIQYLEETSRDHPNATIRARAKAELARYR
ncbi:MAG: protein kinase [Myxococcales bacterium]|nr:protein kinase [Myxococcales bacterium]